MPDLLPKIKEICRLFEIKPTRSKGQNFLVNERIYDEIVEAADLQPDDTVLEIGPGLGFLTAKLARKAKKVIAVELDDKLASYLKAGFESQDVDNVEIVNKDILQFNTNELPERGKYKIVANLPYNITSIFLRIFLEAERRPSLMVLMLQKEVAERISALPPDMSILSTSVKYYSEPEIIREVKAGNFWPEPEVDSAIIRLKVNNNPYSPQEDKVFFRIVRTGFSSKRKMLKNNLSAGLKVASKVIEEALVNNSLNPQARAEDLSVEDWQKLVAALKPFMV